MSKEKQQIFREKYFQMINQLDSLANEQPSLLLK